MEDSIAPHVLILPYPAEGHIKPLLNLAKLLSKYGGFKITFINSHHHHALLHRFTDLQAFHSEYPHINFASITDGLPPDHPRFGLSCFDAFSPHSRSVVAPEFRELFDSVCRKTGQWKQPTCIIADGAMSTIVIDVVEEFKVPFISFRTYSATCTWVTLHYEKLIQNGTIPVQHEDMDKLVTSIPGLEHFLRGRDLPSICRSKPENLTTLDFFIKEVEVMKRASALILNTFDELEATFISKLSTVFPKLYTIGPLHYLIKSHIENSSSSFSSNASLRKEDRRCMAWLDSQRPKSVLYVSFGTVVGLSRDQLWEFWHGFVNSGKKFLWVIRQNLIIDEGHFGQNIPKELEKGTKERGFVVEWAPQEEVLAHPAVSGFFTHSGWNSTLEGITDGVPMICWPLMTEQTTNSRCVSDQWTVGVDMKDTCDRLIMEKMVRNVMEGKGEVIMESTDEIARKAQESVKENGSSYNNLEKLIQDIRSMKVN